MASGPCAALTGRTHGCTDQCCKREESSCQLGAVHTWPFSTFRGNAAIQSLSDPSGNGPLVYALRGPSRLTQLRLGALFVLGVSAQDMAGGPPGPPNVSSSVPTVALIAVDKSTRKICRAAASGGSAAASSMWPYPSLFSVRLALTGYIALESPLNYCVAIGIMARDPLRDRKRKQQAVPNGNEP